MNIHFEVYLSTKEHRKENMKVLAVLCLLAFFLSVSADDHSDGGEEPTDGGTPKDPKGKGDGEMGEMIKKMMEMMKKNKSDDGDDVHDDDAKLGDMKKLMQKMMKKMVEMMQKKMSHEDEEEEDEDEDEYGDMKKYMEKMMMMKKENEEMDEMEDFMDMMMMMMMMKEGEEEDDADEEDFMKMMMMRMMGMKDNEEEEEEENDMDEEDFMKMMIMRMLGMKDHEEEEEEEDEMKKKDFMKMMMKKLMSMLGGGHGDRDVPDRYMGRDRQGPPRRRYGMEWGRQEGHGRDYDGPRGYGRGRDMDDDNDNKQGYFLRMMLGSKMGGWDYGRDRSRQGDNRDMSYGRRRGPYGQRNRYGDDDDDEEEYGMKRFMMNMMGRRQNMQRPSGPMNWGKSGPGRSSMKGRSPSFAKMMMMRFFMSMMRHRRGNCNGRYGDNMDNRLQGWMNTRGGPMRMRMMMGMSGYGQGMPRMGGSRMGPPGPPMLGGPMRRGYGYGSMGGVHDGNKSKNVDGRGEDDKPKGPRYGYGRPGPMQGYGQGYGPMRRRPDSGRPKPGDQDSDEDRPNGPKYGHGGMGMKNKEEQKKMDQIQRIMRMLMKDDDEEVDMTSEDTEKMKEIMKKIMTLLMQGGKDAGTPPTPSATTAATRQGEQDKAGA